VVLGGESDPDLAMSLAHQKEGFRHASSMAAVTKWSRNSWTEPDSPARRHTHGPRIRYKQRASRTARIQPDGGRMIGYHLEPDAPAEQRTD
jgi:hypothetical protein